MLNVSEVGTQIRTAWRAKYKMLSGVLDCLSRLQVKIFILITGMHTLSVLSCLSILHILVELLLVRIQILHCCSKSIL